MLINMEPMNYKQNVKQTSVRVTRFLILSMNMFKCKFLASLAEFQCYFSSYNTFEIIPF
jgi:hypothetical protein